MLTSPTRPSAWQASPTKLRQISVRLSLLLLLLWQVLPVGADGQGVEPAIDGPVAQYPWLLPVVALLTACLILFAGAVIRYQRRVTRRARRGDRP